MDMNLEGTIHVRQRDTLQMKGRWKSNLNVWFSFMYSQKWNCYFQNRIIMFCLPVPSLIYPWEIYIFPGSVCYFAAIAQRHMTMEIGTEAAQFSEKEYINGIFLAVQKKLFTADLPYSCLLQRGGQAVFCAGCSGSYRPASQCRLYGTLSILLASLVLPFAIYPWPHYNRSTNTLLI